MAESIWLEPPATAAELQARLETQSVGASVKFTPRREYPGPVVLGKDLLLDGREATLWALRGPVLEIRAAVCLRHLRIEVTGEGIAPDSMAACAIIVAAGGRLTMENVDVRGLVLGLPQEEGIWQYPHGLALGGIAPGVAHHWQISLRVPVDCKIESRISGLKVAPSELRAGVNDLQVHIDALPRDFLIDGHLLLSTAALRRRIVVSAYADESPVASRGQGQVIWAPPAESLPPTVAPAAPPPPTPPEPIALDNVLPVIVTVTPPASSASPPGPAPAQPPAKDRTPRLRRGQLPNGLFAGTRQTSLPTTQTTKGGSIPQRDQIPGQYFVEIVKPVTRDHELSVAHQELVVPERYLDHFNPTPSKIPRRISLFSRESLVGSLFEVNNDKSQQQYNRRLPFYFLMDTSKNTGDGPIEAMRQGIKLLLLDLKSDPQAIETLWLSLITFDKDARQLVPLTQLTNFVEPSLQASKLAGVALGKAIYILNSCLDREINLPKSGQKGDWQPIVFVIISDNPTDNIHEAIMLIKKKINLINIQVIVCGPSVDSSIFSFFNRPVFYFDTLQPDSFNNLFKWKTIPFPLIG